MHDNRYIPIFDISIQLNLYQYCITGLVYHDMAIYQYIVTSLVHEYLILFITTLMIYLQALNFVNIQLPTVAASHADESLTRYTYSPYKQAEIIKYTFSNAMLAMLYHYTIIIVRSQYKSCFHSFVCFSVYCNHMYTYLNTCLVNYLLTLA